MHGCIAKIPWTLLLSAAALLVVGWLGIARAQELFGSKGYVARQLCWSAVALVGTVAAALPNSRHLCRFSYVAMAAALVALTAVLLFPPINGARSWIRIGPVGVQPSEFAKLAFVLCVARYLMYRRNYTRLAGLCIPLGLALVPVWLILKEPDLGTALVFGPVLFAMLLVAGARLRDLALVAMLAAAALPAIWTQMNREQRSRITAMFEPCTPGVAPSDDAYHLYQSKRTFALGGTRGSLFDERTDEHALLYTLPAAHTDFIFAVLAERFGWWGTAGVLLLYLMLVWSGLGIAAGTREPFGRLVAVGLTALVAVQVLVNAAMTVGLAPITGLSLPLVSYGGSGLLVTGIGLGLLANIAMRPGYELSNEPFRDAAY